MAIASLEPSVTTKSMERVNTPGTMEMELKSRRSLENGKTMYLLGHGDNDDIKFEVYESFLFLKKLEFFNFNNFKQSIPNYIIL